MNDRPDLFPAKWLGVLAVKRRRLALLGGTPKILTTYCLARSCELQYPSSAYPPLPRKAGLYGLVELDTGALEYWPMTGEGMDVRSESEF